MENNSIVQVTHRGTKICIRYGELKAWSQMTFSQRERHLKAMRQKLSTGKYIRDENGAIMKKEDAV